MGIMLVGVVVVRVVGKGSGIGGGDVILVEIRVGGRGDIEVCCVRGD